MADRGAEYDRLVAPHESAIRSYVRRMLPDAEEAADAAQEVLLTACRKLHALRSVARALPWLKAIARSVCYRYSRRRAGVSQVAQAEPESPELDGAGESASAEQALLAAESGRRMLEAIDSLPSRYRQPLCLKYLDGCSYQEISVYLDLDHTQVDQRLRTGRKRLSEALARRSEKRG